MCGRYNLFTSAAEISQSLDTLFDVEYRPRYNIAPTQVAPVIRAIDGERQASLMRWGLIPFWAKDEKIGYRMINARAETVQERSSFKVPFKRRRCLVPATGFYEWKKLDSKDKQPYHIAMADGSPFAFAGLWETWKGPKDAPLEEPLVTFTILTTEPNELTAELHDRMPVIMPPDHYDMWLDPEFEDTDQLQALLGPYPADEMQAYPVSKLVNSPKKRHPRVHRGN